MMVLARHRGPTCCASGRSATLSHSISAIVRLSVPGAPAIDTPFVFLFKAKWTIASVNELACSASKTDLLGSAGNGACRTGFIGCPGPVEARLWASSSRKTQPGWQMSASMTLYHLTWTHPALTRRDLDKDAVRGSVAFLPKHREQAGDRNFLLISF